MDKDTLRKQIENMRYQAQMERWPLSKSIQAYVLTLFNYTLLSLIYYYIEQYYCRWSSLLLFFAQILIVRRIKPVLNI